MLRFWNRLRLTLEMIKFEHSVFALPFALTGALLALRDASFQIPDLGTRFLWIVIAMVAARSAAMTFNRILDADIDARNRRTAKRHLPAGLLSPQFAWGFTAVTSGVFILAARQLGPLCLLLSPVALGILFFYSFCKRFTSFSHLFLGFCLGIAPSAAWIAMRGSLNPRILWLTAAVMFWTAGFDVIYACQDYDFDQTEDLFSLPRRLGIPMALVVSKLLHVAMIVSLVALSLAFHLGPLSFAGILAVLVLLVYEHGLVKPTDLSRVNAAFFTVNGCVSVLFFVFWAADILLHRYSL
jgi:4-hydroxybenzoate polyprenyltransferase